MSEVGDSNHQGDKACRIMEDRMPESKQDHAANLHNYGAQARTAAVAAAAHRRGDHETAGELSERAREYSLNAAQKTEEFANRMPERLRA